MFFRSTITQASHVNIAKESRFRTTRNIYNVFSCLYSTKTDNNGVNESDTTKKGNNTEDGKEDVFVKNVIQAFEELKGKIKKGQSLYEKYSTQLSDQKYKIRKALSEAERNFQEKEASEQMNLNLNYNIDASTGGKIVGLPSERELHRKKWSRKLEFYLDSLQETIFSASRAFNDVTGYSSVQKLRNSVDFLQNQLKDTKVEVKKYKAKYADAIDRRNASQRQLNELLQRKSSWSSKDLENFTRIYKDDAKNTKDEQELKKTVFEWENKHEKLNEDLYNAILTRYHEEQIWSDKIRRTSSYSSFFLMGMNLFLFLILQLFLEPWKRKRLTRSFEDKVKVALADTTLPENETEKKLEVVTQKLNNLLEQQNSSKKTSPSTIHIGLVLNSLDVNSIWLWIKSFANKLKHIHLLDINSNTTFSTLEIYSLVLLSSISSILIKRLF